MVVGNGSFSTPQTVNYDASNDASPGVTFRAETQGGVELAGQNNTWEAALLSGRTGPPAHWVTFDGFRYTGQINLHYSGGIRPANITIRNSTIDHRPDSTDGELVAALQTDSVKDFAMENVSIGPVCCNNDAAQIAQSGAGTRRLTASRSGTSTFTMLSRAAASCHRPCGRIAHPSQTRTPETTSTAFKPLVGATFS